MKFVAYIRTATQNLQLVETQRNQIVHWIAAQPGELVEIYVDEASSAHNQQRPALLQMQADAEQGGFDAVVVTNVHRLSRNKTELAAILSYLQTQSIAAYSFENGPLTGNQPQSVASVKSVSHFQ
ncbi:MAG: recombinase family protein [Caldilineaceae bacterium]|nr:recombinase family protein [Caldilineaceae bacterium]